MIADLVKGRGFRGCISYTTREGQPERKDATIIGGNMAGQTARQLSAEFGLIRKLRPNLSRAVLHASLSNPATDRELSTEEWNAIAKRFLHGLGYLESLDAPSDADAPFIVIRHDAINPHIHIVASRVNAAGKTISDAHDYRRAESILREIEKDYGLTPVPSGKAATPKQQKQRRTTMNEEYVQQRLEGAADAAEAERHQEEGVLIAGGGCAEPLNERELREARRETQSREYEDRMRSIFGDQFKSIYPLKRGAVIYTIDGGRIHDEGDRLTAYKTDPQTAARRIVELGASKNWKAMRFWGPPAFVEACIREARRFGIKVVPIDEAQARLIEAINGETGGGGGGISLKPQPKIGKEVVEDPAAREFYKPAPTFLPPPSPFGDELSRKFVQRRRKDEEQRQQFKQKRDGGFTP